MRGKLYRPTAKIGLRRVGLGLPVKTIGLIAEKLTGPSWNMN